MEEEKKYLPLEVKSYKQLEEIFQDFRIDSEKTRFYIGKDYTEPRAFVIYEDDFGNYVVYKMKADGSRALRYKGPDEEYAVNEYYQKFLEEIRKRPEFARKLLGNDKRNQTPKVGKDDGDLKWFIILFISIFVAILFSMMNLLPKWVILALFLAVNPGIFIWLFISKQLNRDTIIPPKWYSIIALVVILLFGFTSNINKRISHRKDGYYIVNKHPYYRQGRDMYYFINDTWTYYGTYDDFIDDYDYYDYYDYYIDNNEYDNFENSYYYDDWKKEDSWSSSDFDSDSGWSDSDSWDSWDSGGTDWDSDW